MKILILSLLISSPLMALDSDCKDLVKEVNNKDLFAAIHSSDHMHMELSVVLKDAFTYTVAIVEGEKCPAYLEDAQAMGQRTFHQAYFAGSSSLKLEVNICHYGLKRNEDNKFIYTLKKSYSLCNEVSGD